VDALDALREFSFGDGTPLTITVDRPLTPHGQRLADSLGVRVEVRPVTAPATRKARPSVRRFDHDEAKERYAAGETVADLARAYGVHRNSMRAVLSQIETGRMLPADKFVAQLELAYGPPADWYAPSLLLAIQNDGGDDE